MNYKITIGLVISVVIVILVGFFLVNALHDETPKVVRQRQTFFYQVDDDDINTVTIEHLGQQQAYTSDAERTWRFGNPNGEKVHLERWGGVTLLLSGPQFTRVITERATDLDRYGLQEPTTVITVGLKDIGEVRIMIGDETPDGVSSYVQFQDEDRIVLVDGTWGKVMSRLVTEPPHIPTPTPEPSPTPEPTKEAAS